MKREVSSNRQQWTWVSRGRNLVVVSAEERELLENEDDGLGLAASAVQALQEELQMFGERPENLEKWISMMPPRNDTPDKWQLGKLTTKQNKLPGSGYPGSISENNIHATAAQARFEFA